MMSNKNHFVTLPQNSEDKNYKILIQNPSFSVNRKPTVANKIKGRLEE